MRNVLLRARSLEEARQVAELVHQDEKNPTVENFGRLALQVVRLESGNWGVRAEVMRKPHAVYLERYYVKRFGLTPENCSGGGAW